MRIPSNILEYGRRRGRTAVIKKIAKWAEDVGASIRGGTAIGKNYDSLILDLSYQDGAIHYHPESGISLYNEKVRTAAEFKEIYEKRKKLLTV